MSEYFPERKSLEGRVKVELDLELLELFHMKIINIIHKFFLDECLFKR